MVVQRTRSSTTAITGGVREGLVRALPCEGVTAVLRAKARTHLPSSDLSSTGVVAIHVPVDTSGANAEDEHLAAVVDVAFDLP